MSRSSEHPRIQPPPRWNHRLHEAAHEDDTAKGGRAKRTSRKSLVEDPAGFNLRMHELAHESDEMAGNLLSTSGTIGLQDEVTIWSYGKNSIGDWLAVADSAAGLIGTAQVWQTANRAVYVPFFVIDSYTVDLLFCWIHTSSGNLDLGIYTEDGEKILSTGSTASPGTGLRTFDVTNTTLDKGVYYMAMSVDNITFASRRGTIDSAVVIRTSGCVEQLSAFPLPQTAAFVIYTGTFVPPFGLTKRTF